MFGVDVDLDVGVGAYAFADVDVGVGVNLYVDLYCIHMLMQMLTLMFALM